MMIKTKYGVHDALEWNAGFIFDQIPGKEVGVELVQGRYNLEDLESLIKMLKIAKKSLVKNKSVVDSY